jgi:hypothetical protein
MKRHFAIAVLAIVIGLSGNAEAKTKIYKSNSDLPFVEMMLGMMVAMGILDKIPTELVGLNRYPTSPLSYRALAYRNLNNKNLRKRYLASRYLANRYPGAAGLYPLSSTQYGTNVSPLYNNPMLGFPGSSPFKTRRYRDSYMGNGWLPMRRSTCVSGSCLSQRNNSLNGLWVGEDGEMLGIKNDQFLWTDGHDQHMTGLMNISEDHVEANIDGSDRQISYDYRVQGNELLTKDASGVIRRFLRY